MSLVGTVYYNDKKHYCFDSAFFIKNGGFMKKVGLGILNVSLVIITAIMSVFSVVYIYYTTIGKNKLPSGVTSTYATTITDPQSGEELPVIEARYYANTNKIGYEVVELLFNCYSGVGKQAVYSRGFQLVFDKDGNLVQDKEKDGCH